MELTEFQYNQIEKLAKVCTPEEIAQILHISLNDLSQDQRFAETWARVQNYERQKAKKLIFGNETKTKTKHRAGLKSEGLI